MLKFDELTVERQEKVLKTLSRQILDHIIEGVLNVGDDEFQKGVDFIVEGSTSVESARLQLSILLNGRLDILVLQHAYDFLYGTDGTIIAPTTSDDDFLFI